MLHIHTIGLDIHHIGEFCIDRPHGSDDHLLVIFKSEAIVHIGGAELFAPPDSAILYTPGHPQLYRTHGRTYVNHFLHFSMDEADQFSFGKKMPLNTLFQPGGVSELEDLMRLISLEQICPSPRRDEYIDLLSRLLLMKLEDSCTGMHVRGLCAHSSELNKLRADIYTNAGRYSSVEQLAQQMAMSVSYFHQLYKTHFGVSCYEDLLAAKLQAARYYLRSTEMPIREIAAMCGYENDVCFMRLFKRRMGRTPSEYRAESRRE